MRRLEKSHHEDGRTAAVSLAVGALGLWSALGIDETKELFRKSYDRGKVFATRQTFYDAFFSLLSGRTEENIVEFVLRWVMIALSNFTVGMASAVISFHAVAPHAHLHLRHLHLERRRLLRGG